MAASKLMQGTVLTVTEADEKRLRAAGFVPTLAWIPGSLTVTEESFDRDTGSARLLSTEDAYRKVIEQAEKRESKNGAPENWSPKLTALRLALARLLERGTIRIGSGRRKPR